MPDKLSVSAQKVQNTLKELGFSNKVVELPNTTRSAAEAAEAIGCQVAQIAKSLVFKTKRTGRPILVIASGINRVDEKKMREYVGERIGKANADFVRQQTGFVIGGVPPLGHLEDLDTFIDEDLLHYDEIWAAAGNPFAVFKLTPTDLVKMAEGRVVNLK
jgi:prolyl-tRNA editing enzyme YbaK/EbsC (Cys-tRNA(Pro) deacylase)